MFHVGKMALNKEKDAVRVNPHLTLRGIPPSAHDYKLGSRSALDWVIDQYRIKGEGDPNRAADPQYIVRLVKRVVTVSVETVRLVGEMPGLGF